MPSLLFVKKQQFVICVHVSRNWSSHLPLVHHHASAGLQSTLISMMHNAWLCLALWRTFGQFSVADPAWNSTKSIACWLFLVMLKINLSQGVFCLNQVRHLPYFQAVWHMIKRIKHLTYLTRDTPLPKWCRALHAEGYFFTQKQVRQPCWICVVSEGFSVLDKTAWLIITILLDIVFTEPTLLNT